MLNCFFIFLFINFQFFLGGKEYLRVLNELISDFDEILSKTEYR